MSTLLKWVNPTKNVDESAYSAATDQAGIEISLNETPAVAVPTGAGTSFELESLDAFKAIPQGANYTLGLAVVSKAGGKSAPAGGTFRKKVLVPKSPTSLEVVVA